MSDAAPSRYDYAFDPEDDASTAARICRLVGRDKEVLELGCAAGAMSAVLTHHYGCRVTGVEFDAVAARAAEPHTQEIIVASLEDPAWAEPLAGRRFDTILAADVLEHLHDPAACLRQFHPLLKPDGRIVVSVPNIAHGGVVASLLCGEFEYCEVGLLDRTHVHFFTPASLGRMLQATGFEVELETAAHAGAWHPEFSVYWKALPPGLAAWLEKGPSANVYQAIAVARPNMQAQAYMPKPHEHWLQEADGCGAREQPPQEDEGRIRELEEALAGMRASLSWRVTAPLRACARWLRRGGSNR